VSKSPDLLMWVQHGLRIGTHLEDSGITERPHRWFRDRRGRQCELDRRSWAV